MLTKNQLKLVRSLELKKNRKKEGLFVAEGPKVVGDLLRAGFVPHSIFMVQGSGFMVQGSIRRRSSPSSRYHHQAPFPLGRGWG